MALYGMTLHYQCFQFFEQKRSTPLFWYKGVLRFCFLLFSVVKTTDLWYSYYHINRIIEETGKSFGDEAHIIYVNSQIKDETALGKLMHDFSCTDPDEMNYPVLAQRVRYFKEDTKGVTTMCRAMEEMRENTKHEQAIEIALKLLKKGKMTCEEISDTVGLSVDEVKALDGKKSA